uniref:Uncharacterized protein n=1 Tax=Arundo donax TaxID=35708 RepID=A0A0A9B4H7_ARUDO
MCHSSPDLTQHTQFFEKRKASFIREVKD